MWLRVSYAIVCACAHLLQLIDIISACPEYRLLLYPISQILQVRIGSRGWIDLVRLAHGLRWQCLSECGAFVTIFQLLNLSCIVPPLMRGI